MSQSVPAGGAGGPKSSLPATVGSLLRELKGKPVLFVGAGASMAAGYPSTGRLVERMVAEADDPIDAGLPFPRVAEEFVASRGGGALGELLQREIGRATGRPTAWHAAMARAAGAVVTAVLPSSRPSSSPPLTPIQQYGLLAPMKATIEVPDDLYRQVKAKSALEGRAIREVAVELFESYVAGEGARTSEEPPAQFAGEARPSWFGALNKAARKASRHDMDSIRRSIAAGLAREHGL